MPAIPEAKIQSTGQAGPEINRDLEVLFGRLNELIRATNGIQTTVDALSGGSSGSPSTDSGSDDSGETSVTFSPVADTAAILAGNAGPVSTEGAYTTVTPTIAVSNARFAEILFVVNSTDNADDGDLKCKGLEGIESPILAECIAGTDDARDGVIHWVRLDGAGSFQYKFTNTSTTSIEWAVTYMGYSL